MIVSPHQQELFESAMKLFHGNSSRDIKTAVVNLMVTMLAQNSSNCDEAILQWNELSGEFQRLIEEKFRSKIQKVDDTQLAKFRFNGG